MIREEIRKSIKKEILELQKGKVFPVFDIPEIKVEHPEISSHGDYSTNIAMMLARQVKKNPAEIAEVLVNRLLSLKVYKLYFEKAEALKPGFVNFFISKEYLQKQVAGILKEGEKFSSLNIGKNKKVNVEFISANPTGPLTLGNGRGGFCGDVLANVLIKAGYKVTREYYINDVGEQIRKLGHSVIGDTQFYKGSYIENLKEKIKDSDPDKAGGKAAGIILKEIKETVEKMKIKFDVWFSERSLYEKGETEKVLRFLKKKKLIYEKEGALWFKSSQFGDDKDRVLIKADGETTYFLSDIAYLKNKFNRGFNRLFFFWGADHYGYIGRIKAAAQALGYKEERIEVIIMQLVAIMWTGEVARMSKREGIYRTIEELVKGLGIDIVRFFFLTKSPGSHLIFNLELAKEQSEKNPVFYVQYAYARIHSILAKSEIRNPKPETNSKLKIQDPNLKLLSHPSELALIKQLIRFPEIIEDTARDYQVQRLPQCALDLAAAFHQFYRDCKVISEDKELARARLDLVAATKITLKNTLDLMGILAPEKM